ncbi:MAG: hypothetical protein LBG11_11815, partial [Bifidobacteriaceae bacterium]|nr:hypothetical protein [Bifidobacteriaceae bacterium]
MLERLNGTQFPDFSDGGRGEFLDPDIRDFFDGLFRWTNRSRGSVIKDAKITRTYGYQIMDGTRVAKRDYYLSLSFALGLDLTTTQHML